MFLSTRYDDCGRQKSLYYYNIISWQLSISCWGNYVSSQNFSFIAFFIEYSCNEQWTQPRYDVIWNFTPIIFFSSLRIFYVKMVTSDGGGGHKIILNYCDRAKKYIYICMYVCVSVHFSEWIFNPIRYNGIMFKFIPYKKYIALIIDHNIFNMQTKNHKIATISENIYILTH